MGPPQEAELLSRFMSEIEFLGGKAYLASSPAEVGRIVSEIAFRTQSTSIVKQTLQISDEHQITSELEGRGLLVTELQECSSPLDILTKTDLTITRADLLIAQTG